MSAFASIEVRAGPRALAHLRARGVTPADIRCIPAAAGGPKGLALLPLDRRLHDAGYAERGVRLVGASIGAWRMTALASPDAPAAIERLRRAYVREQNYRAHPSPREVSDVIRGVVRALQDGRPPQVREGVALEVLTARARGPLAGRESKAAFARAALDNALARPRLAAHLHRVVFTAGATSAPDPFDAFGALHVPLDAGNTEDALLASGSIPLVCAPVRDIAGAPPGDYWDGGLIDYHLLLPYASAPGLVLYPHFAAHVTPGACRTASCRIAMTSTATAPTMPVASATGSARSPSANASPTRRCASSRRRMPTACGRCSAAHARRVHRRRPFPQRPSPGGRQAAAG